MTAQSPRSAVAVILVNKDGQLLLQHRDHHAPVGPSRWSTVGGAVELGEDALDAAHRELAEETSLTGQLLELWSASERPANSGVGRTRWSVFVGATAAGDADVVVGEGLEILFVPVERVEFIDLLPAARHFVDKFVESDDLRRLTAIAASLRREP